MLRKTLPQRIGWGTKLLSGIVRLMALSMILCCCAMQQSEAQTYFYYYKGAKQALSLNTEYVYVVTPPSVNSVDELNRLLDGRGSSLQVTSSQSFATLKPMDGSAAANVTWASVKIANRLSASEYFAYLAQLKTKGLSITSPYFSNAVDSKIGLTQYFYVKLKSSRDITRLQTMAANLGAIVVGQNKFMPLWYTLSITAKATVNALQAANIFYESGLFTYAEPDLITENDAFAANDPYYISQWGLNNTGLYGGTSGIDINAVDAWEITKGSREVTVAVLDEGIEMNHPDLAGNIIGTGFDSESGTSPAQVLGSHGTACAGIIGAIQDNNIGVSGVAPVARLMSVSNSLAGTPLSRQKRADGINWAWNNGADIISNSWGSSVAYAIIDDAIDNALTLGRGGLGTLVVFASGNNNGAVSYPANSNADIVVVGAMSECGERKSPTSCDGENWGSNFGATLDVVAPGVLVATTDRQGAGAGYNNGSNIHPSLGGPWISTDFADPNYTVWFNGTSSATPMVSGVAALILSVNPCLTHDQVEDILEQSAQKVGGYAYAPTGGRPNGTWFTQMGYGLVDAHAAVVQAIGLLPSASGADLFSKDRPFDAGDEPNPDSGPMYISEDIWIRQNPDGQLVHQNPEFKLTSPNAIYVRVTNRGKVTSTCTNLSVYFSKASTGLVWPTHWSDYFQATSAGSVLHGDKINTVSIPAIAPGASHIVEVPWFPPNPADFDADVHHFCILTRVEGPSDPMFNEQTFVGVDGNVRSNNNIAWKNVSVFNNDADDSDVAVFVRGVERKASYVNLRFLDKGFREEFKVRFFERGGEATLTVDKKMIEPLKNAKISGSIKQIDDVTYVIYGADAMIGNLLLEPKETFLLRLKMKAQLSEKEEVVLDVLQQNAKTRTIDGGERFLIRAGKDQQLAIATAASEKQSTMVYPNPARGEVFVNYTVDADESLVHIQVSDIYNVNKKISLFQGHRAAGDYHDQLSLRNLPRGVYFMTVQINGRVMTERFSIE